MSNAYKQTRIDVMKFIASEILPKVLSSPGEQVFINGCDIRIQ